MIGRVTAQGQYATATRNLQHTSSSVDQLMQQGASGAKHTRPSDSPLAASDSLKVRSALAAHARHERNIDDANAWLTTIDSSLHTSLDLLNRARDLTVQGASGTNSQDSREALAKEIDALGEELLKQANTEYLGRSVFAGTSDAPAYTTDYAHTGQPDAAVSRRIGPDQTVAIDVPGSQVFGTGDDSVFATLDRVASSLRDGGQVAPDIETIDTHLRDMTSTLADVGSRHGQVMRAQSDAADQSVSLETRRSSIEDIDLAELILDLEVARTSYTASLNITAQSLPTSLMDFI